MSALAALSFQVSGFATGLLFAGYRWGQFAAERATEGHTAKWKTYLAAPAPPAAFSLSFHFDSMLSPPAGKAFFVVGATALLGVIPRWGRVRGNPDSV